MNNTMLTVRPNLGETVPRFVIIPNFENYKINEFGEIYNIKRNTKISTYIGIDNYEHCVLYRNGKRYRKRVHSLMGKAFLGNPQVVDHIDHNKSNNRLNNLRGCSHKDNIMRDRELVIKPKPIICINKINNKEHYAKSMREAERITNIDRHRIKTFLEQTRSNHTNWDFKYNK